MRNGQFIHIKLNQNRLMFPKSVRTIKDPKEQISNGQIQNRHKDNPNDITEQLSVIKNTRSILGNNLKSVTSIQDKIMYK